MNGILREHDISINIPWGKLDLHSYYYQWFPQGILQINLHSLGEAGLTVILLSMISSGNITS
jgi:hypothetical protein